ncbi:hypothetical protein R5W23_005674 [Gemmata sp. JC673]|uniref:Uncharacterized protein n=1 Tax=Gemmata algarum TaxID=2975278 RepID=A0ABU5EY34_9BACT|nr:hypothetical protein [Gemmata algarum]MDY3558554.1 hypothetical protein [Gemmata algarum]
MTDVQAVIDRCLTATRVPGSPNEFTAAEVRNLALEYLRGRDEELQIHPWIRGLPHWNLWMTDAELDDAIFAVLAFGPDGVVFTCGTGNSFAIRRWDADEPHDAAKLTAELRRAFRVPEPVIFLTRADAETWLRRDW